jgi:hypothetical protein
LCFSSSRYPPPAYVEIVEVAAIANDQKTGNMGSYGNDKHSWYDVRYWEKRVWIGLLFLLAVIIVVPVVVTTMLNDRWRNRYPDYTKLTYKLSDTCRHMAFPYRSTEAAY